MKILSKHGYKSNKMFYTIAEIGINHGGDIGVAKKLIDSASLAGADAVKFQTYITEKRVSKNSPIYSILKQCELPFNDFEILKYHADALNIDFFSTPFDSESVDCLEGIGVDKYKIASFDVCNRNLLEYIGNTGKTILMSIGMASYEEVKAAYDLLIKLTNNLTLLHCISAYPTEEKDANIGVIHDIKNEFECVIGHSDHTNDIVVPIYAAAAGAQVIEKHYKIDDRMNCVDSPVSINEKQMAELVNILSRLENIIGSSKLELSEAEKGTAKFRRYS